VREREEERPKRKSERDREKEEGKGATSLPESPVGPPGRAGWFRAIRS